jgi:triacylglycerol esterase/lipase EstA (alpha/beta hydrolase family)
MKTDMLPAALRQTIVTLIAAVILVSCAPARQLGEDRIGFLKHAGKPNLIVFVHGVTGDAAATWRNAATGALWPQMIADDGDLGDFDVYLAGYDSPLVGRSSTIEEIAQRLLRELRDQGVFERYAQVHFVTHSMGGLITKRMLVELNGSQAGDVERLRRVRTVLFLSTPAQGAEVATIGALLSDNPQFANMEPARCIANHKPLENESKMQHAARH